MTNCVNCKILKLKLLYKLSKVKIIWLEFKDGRKIALIFFFFLRFTFFSLKHEQDINEQSLMFFFQIPWFDL